jgi:hypothetical protein
LHHKEAGDAPRAGAESLHGGLDIVRLKIEPSKILLMEIPATVFSHWHTKELPSSMEEAVKRLSTLNPEFTHTVYDNDMCRSFIKDTFDSSVLEAYDSLIPESYKSDLWRYCVLYTHGGIYLDIKYVTIGAFSLHTLRDKERFCQGTNGILVCTRGNEVLRKCIDAIVEHCKNITYGSSYQSPTGSDLIAQCIPLEYIYELSLQNGRILYNDIPVLEEYSDYQLDRELFGSTSKMLWGQKNIYRKKEPPHLYFLVTTSLFNDSPLRKEQYTHGITQLKNVLSKSKLTNYTILILENNGKRPTILDDLGCKVYYTTNNRLTEFDKGYRELQDIFDCIQEFQIQDNDFIIKMTGRYSIHDDSNFIRTLETLDLSQYECIIKFGSYMNLGKYNPLDDINMGDCITGLTAMKCKYVKQVEYPLGYDIVEWNWAKVARRIHEFKLCKLEQLGISICPSGDIYFPV